MSRQALTAFQLVPHPKSNRQRSASVMQCPKCDGTMERRAHGRKIAVERCNKCFGLFCEPEVLAEMKTAWMSEILDEGDPNIGKRYDAVANVDCPQCHTRMTRKNDPGQTHIWFEECASCGGIFFDAGEFSDWKYETFFDGFRDLLHRRGS